mmetsp:Transcript_14405/g.54522  ORF Transcript_14405/g.54522 Transcript_14405/m.54522 type:complete len:353 (-) Transcript_14405:1702-2760(-)
MHQRFGARSKPCGALSTTQRRAQTAAPETQGWPRPPPTRQPAALRTRAEPHRRPWRRLAQRPRMPKRRAAPPGGRWQTCLARWPSCKPASTRPRDCAETTGRPRNAPWTVWAPRFATRKPGFGPPSQTRTTGAAPLRSACGSASSSCPRCCPASERRRPRESPARLQRSVRALCGLRWTPPKRSRAGPLPPSPTTRRPQQPAPWRRGWRQTKPHGRPRRPWLAAGGTAPAGQVRRWLLQPQRRPLPPQPAPRRRTGARLRPFGRRGRALPSLSGVCVRSCAKWKRASRRWTASWSRREARFRTPERRAKLMPSGGAKRCNGSMQSWRPCARVRPTPGAWRRLRRGWRGCGGT